MNEIQDLKRQGLSISAIVDMTGFNRRTIRKYLSGSAEVVPVYGPREPRPTKLDAYTGCL